MNSVITIKDSQDTSLGEKLDKIDTNAQSVASATNFSVVTTLHSGLNMLTTGSKNALNVALHLHLMLDYR